MPRRGPLRRLPPAAGAGVRRDQGRPRRAAGASISGGHAFEKGRCGAARRNLGSCFEAGSARALRLLLVGVGGVWAGWCGRVVLGLGCIRAGDSAWPQAHMRTHSGVHLAIASPVPTTNHADPVPTHPYNTQLGTCTGLPWHSGGGCCYCLRCRSCPSCRYGCCRCRWRYCCGC